MNTLTRANKTALNTSNCLQFIEQEFAKHAATNEETTSSLYWGNVLNSKTRQIDESENLVSNKTQQIKRRIYWWM